MGFVDPRKDREEDQGLPGASGLHLDLDLRRCPVCRRELHPWEERCPDCDEVGVDATQVRADPLQVPGLAALMAEEDAAVARAEDAEDAPGGGGDREVDDPEDGDASA